MSRRSQRVRFSLQSSSSDDTPADDIARILQYLVRSSGQIRVFSSDGWYLDISDSDDDVEELLTPSRPKFKPDTKVIDKSEFRTLTLSDTGQCEVSSHPNLRSLPSWLSTRERGMAGSMNWSRKDRCRITNGFLPNDHSVMDCHRNKVFCGTYSKDGDVFLSACQDCKIRAYRTPGQYFQHFKTIEARNVGWSILDTAFSPDANHVAYSSWSESIYLCNLHGSEKHESLPVSPDDRRFCIFSLMFSHDGTKVLGGANDGCLYVHDIVRQHNALKIWCHDTDVNCVAFADDTSQILFSGGDDGACKVWDRRTLNEMDPRPVGVFIGHKHGLTYIDSRGDGRHLITNSKDQSIKLWDMRVFGNPGSVDRTLKGIQNTHWDYRWQKVPKHFFKPNKPLPGDTSVMTYRGHCVLQTLIRCHFSPALTTGQRYIYTGCSSGRIYVYDALTGEVVTTLVGHKGCVRDVSWHPYLNELTSSSWDGKVLRWTYKGKSFPDASSKRVETQTSDSDSDSPKVLRRSERLAAKRHREEASDL